MTNDLKASPDLTGREAKCDIYKSGRSTNADDLRERLDMSHFPSSQFHNPWCPLTGIGSIGLMSDKIHAKRPGEKSP